MKYLAVIQVKHLTGQLLCPLCLAAPPKFFSKSAHDSGYICTVVLELVIDSELICSDGWWI